MAGRDDWKAFEVRQKVDVAKYYGVADYKGIKSEPLLIEDSDDEADMFLAPESHSFGTVYCVNCGQPESGGHTENRCR